MVPRTSIAYYCSQEYEMWDFHIKPILAGKSHQFTHEKHLITVRLPERPKRSDSPVVDRNAPIFCTSWTNFSKRKMPYAFNVHRFKIEVYGGDKCSIRKDAIGKVNGSLFSKVQRHRLKTSALKLRGVADRAFDHWLPVLRWKSDNPFIRPPFGRNESISFGTYLYDNDTRERFYSPGFIITPGPIIPITSSQWKTTQQSLTGEDAVPIWHKYLADAHTRIVSEDAQGAILSLAICVETMVRRIMSNFLAKPADETFLKIVNLVSISAFIDRWRKFGFKSKRLTNAANLKQLRDLFSKRNKIMHRGQRDNISISECRSKFSTVREFLIEGDRYLRNVA